MTPPTDLELMMFHDGELEEARHREVAAYLCGEGSDAKAGTAKLAGLGLVSSLVLESQATVARAQEKQADSIASLVLAELERDNPASHQPHTPKLDTAAANDNGRFIMVLAGLAAAAAAALFVWGRSTPPEAPAASVDTVEAPAADLAAPAPVESVAALPSTSASTAVVPATETDDSEPSVEVASVDFSGHSGAVYYVPSDSQGQTTTVVWLKDE